MIDAFNTSVQVHAARQFAMAALEGKLRAYNQGSAFEHAERVYCMVLESIHSSELAACVALLHDVVEDSSVTIEEIRDRFGESVAIGVLALTNAIVGNRSARHRLNVERLSAATGYIQTIKCCDIIDNVPSIAAQNSKFSALYVNEKAEIIRHMHSADRFLRDRAQIICNSAMNSITGR